MMIVVAFVHLILQDLILLLPRGRKVLKKKGLPRKQQEKRETASKQTEKGKKEK
jgi:hypothetical protein